MLLLESISVLWLGVAELWRLKVKPCYQEFIWLARFITSALIIKVYACALLVNIFSVLQRWRQALLLSAGQFAICFPLLCRLLPGSHQSSEADHLWLLNC